MREVVVVRGGHMLTMGPAGDLADGAVAFAGGQVLQVGPFAEVVAGHPEAEVVGDGALAVQVAAGLAIRGVAPDDFRTHHPDLEDVFLALTGRDLRA